MFIPHQLAPRIEIIVGLPHLSNGPILQRAKALGVPALISANCLSRWESVEAWREWAGWRKGPLANAQGLASLDLDSAGYTLMAKYGGFPWSIRSYMQLASSYPFRRIAAADYCCEIEIAADRHEVLDRISRTIRTNRESRVIAMDMGIADRLMPVLQGRIPTDYERCADALAMSILPGGIVGIGSMCRREIHGPQGLLAVIEHLDRILPKSVRLHAFGVKGSALPWLKTFSHRIASIDSQAWALQARHRALRLGVSKTDAFSADEMQRWLSAQHDILNQPPRRSEHSYAPDLQLHERPSDPWQAAIAEARSQIRDLIESGDLDHDEISEGWIHQWAADLYRVSRAAA